MLRPGKPFGRYTIVREIGRGGMGAVFEAQHSQLNKLVALKTLHGASLDVRSIERFLREGRAAASVRHPHIVDVSDVGVEDQTPFLVMELLEGEDLSRRIAAAAPLTVEETVDVMLPVIDAVRAMHERGIVHRDLKPENIFLSRGLGGELVPKVLDFGVCRDESDDARKLTEGAIVGTPFYLSPEQVEGARGDPFSDQHALGVILYECLSGKKPYDAPTLLGLLAAIRDGDRLPLDARRADLAPALCAAIERALHPSPLERFDDVASLARALVVFASPRARARWEPIVSRDRDPIERPTASERPTLDDAPRGFDPQSPAPVTLRQGSPEASSAVEQRATSDEAPLSPVASRGRSNRTLALVAGGVVMTVAIAASWARTHGSPPTTASEPRETRPTLTPIAARSITAEPSSRVEPTTSADAATVTAATVTAAPPGRPAQDRPLRGRAQRAQLRAAPTQSSVAAQPALAGPQRSEPPAANEAPIVD